LTEAEKACHAGDRQQQADIMRPHEEHRRQHERHREE
jgi:hypothetical protein